MAQSAVEAAIAAAQAAAANIVPQTDNAVANTGGQSNGAVANYEAPKPGAALTAADMMIGSMNVDAWLKVNEFGLFIGTDKTPHSELKVRLDMADILYCFSVRYGNPAQYAKTYDHVLDTKGRPWVETLRMAQNIDSRASEFRSADIPFTIVEPVMAKDGKTVLADAGDTIGVSISVTGWRVFQGFLRDAGKAGIDISNALLEMTLSYEAKKNDKGEWGILTYNDYSEVNDG